MWEDSCSNTKRAKLGYCQVLRPFTAVNGQYGSVWPRTAWLIERYNDMLRWQKKTILNDDKWIFGKFNGASLVSLWDFQWLIQLAIKCPCVSVCAYVCVPLRTGNTNEQKINRDNVKQWWCSWTNCVTTNRYIEIGGVGMCTWSVDAFGDGNTQFEPKTYLSIYGLKRLMRVNHDFGWWWYGQYRVVWDTTLTLGWWNSNICREDELPLLRQLTSIKRWKRSSKGIKEENLCRSLWRVGF